MSRASELADDITPSKDNVPELGDLLDAAAELRRLERVNAELVDALTDYVRATHFRSACKATGAPAKKQDFADEQLWKAHDRAIALTSATKEQQK